MIRHTVMFTWKDDVTDVQKKRVAEELSRLPGVVPSIRAYALGTDMGVNDGNWDFAVSGDFDDRDGYIAYRDDPTHQAIIAKYIQSLVAMRAAVQFEY